MRQIAAIILLAGSLWAQSGISVAGGKSVYGGKAILGSTGALGGSWTCVQGGAGCTNTASNAAFIGGHNSPFSFNITMAVPLTSGNSIFVPCFGGDIATTFTMTVSDTTNGTYTNLPGVTDTQGDIPQVNYFFNSTYTGSTITLNITSTSSTGSAYLSCGALEMHPSGTPSFDSPTATAAQTVAGSCPINSGSKTPASANELFVAAGGDNGGHNDVLTSAGWNVAWVGFSGSFLGDGGAGAYIINTGGSTTAQQATWSCQGASNVVWSGINAAFKPQ